MADTQNTDTQGGVSALTDQVKEQAQQAVQQGQQYAGQAVDVLRTQIKSQLTHQKDALGVGATEVAQIVKKSADDLRGKGLGAFVSPYIEQAAQKLTEFGTTAQQKDIDEVIRDTESFARTQPAVYLSIATLVGFVAARFLKSSGQASST